MEEVWYIYSISYPPVHYLSTMFSKATHPVSTACLLGVEIVMVSVTEFLPVGILA